MHVQISRFVWNINVLSFFLWCGSVWFERTNSTNLWRFCQTWTQVKTRSKDSPCSKVVNEAARKRAPEAWKSSTPNARLIHHGCYLHQPAAAHNSYASHPCGHFLDAVGDYLLCCQCLFWHHFAIAHPRHNSLMHIFLLTMAGFWLLKALVLVCWPRYSNPRGWWINLFSKSPSTSRRKMVASCASSASRRPP